MNHEKYPDEMLIMHLQAQIDRVLDYGFGSVVSDAEYRGLGKTSAIIKRVYYDIVENGLDSRKNVVFVGHSFLQDRYVNELNRLIESGSLPPIVKDNVSIAKLKKLIIIADGNVKGYRVDSETEIAFIDGVPRSTIKEIVKPTIVSANTVIRGFYC